MKLCKFILYSVLFLLIMSCQSSPEKKYTLEYPKSLYKLHQKLPKIEEYYWLSRKNETGQTFKEYLNEKPRTRTKKKTAIYLLPVGNFSALDSQLLEITAEYLSVFYQSKVKIQPQFQGMDTIPKSAQRKYRNAHHQLQTKFILYHILKKNKPADAFVYMAITPMDIYPAPHYNFVFGQASLKHRVGVSSFFRHKEQNLSGLSEEQKFKKILISVLKTTSHELGHILSIRHCTKYRCLMNASNTHSEAENHSFYACPICVKKIHYATQTDLQSRYVQLLAFFEKYNLQTEQKFCTQVLKGTQETIQ